MDELVEDVNVLIIDNPPEADYAVTGYYWRGILACLAVVRVKNDRGK